MNLESTNITNDDEIEFTAGELAIFTRLDDLQATLDELIEKVNNLNLTPNEGLSIESYD